MHVHVHVHVHVLCVCVYLLFFYSLLTSSLQPDGHHCGTQQCVVTSNEKGTYHRLSICAAALTMPQTWNAVDPDVLKTFERMELVMSHNHSFADYRAYLKVCVTMHCVGIKHLIFEFNYLIFNLMFDI